MEQILIKTETLRLHKNLDALLDWLGQEIPWYRLIITCHKRSDGGIHDTDPLRAVDLRCRDKHIGEYIETLINIWWDYGKPPYNCCLAHGAGSNYHLHLQVRDQTKLRSLNTNNRFPQ